MGGVAKLKVPTKAEYAEFWAPRIGPRAAVLMWWSKIVVRRSPLVAGVIFAIIFVAVRLNLGIALGLAWVLGVTGVLFGCSGVVSLLASRRAAHKTLGISIKRNMAPMNREDYIAWCGRNNLVPFAASAQPETP